MMRSTMHEIYRQAYTSIVGKLRQSVFMMPATLLLGGWLSVVYAQPMPGDVLIADQQFGNSTIGFRGGLFVVKPTGARNLLSDFNNAAQGPLGGGGVVGVSGVVVETAGTILVADRNAGTGSRGLVFRVAANGACTILTDFGNAGRDIICGGEGNDMINGGSTNDVIDGGPGDDFIDGGSGKDDIKGGDGDDNMIGGQNKDTCDGGAHVVGDTAAPSCDTVFNVP